MAIEKARRDVQRIVQSSNQAPNIVIARYTAAIAVNFTDWIGKTIPWARHEFARWALIDNLRCESVDDHVGMLLRFARLSGAMPNDHDYEHVHPPVSNIRKMFIFPLEAGLAGVTLCATLESTSEIFIPDLAKKAEACECTDFTYTDVHGEADVEHSDAFNKAVELEADMGYRHPQLIISKVAGYAVRLIKRVYE